MAVTRIEIPEYNFLDGLPSLSGMVNFVLGLLFVLACLITYGSSWFMIGVAFLFLSGDIRQSS